MPLVLVKHENHSNQQFIYVKSYCSVRNGLTDKWPYV